MINVFISNQEYNPMLYYNRHHDLPFLLESDKFNIVHDVKSADIIPDMRYRDTPGHTMEDKIKFLGPNFKDQWIVRMLHTHTHESKPEFTNVYEKQPWLPYTKNIIIVDLNLKNTEEIPYNFVWNRQKAYYTDYDKFDLLDRLWTNPATKKMFSLATIPDFRLNTPVKLKKFLMVGRTYFSRENHPRNIFRLRLQEVIAKVDDSFYSDWNPEAPQLLWPEERVFDNMSDLYKKFTGWWPVANEYYINSFVSVYVETLTITDNSICSVITEKTLDPLIKGHFVLPFGYAGLIEDIKNFGFKVPEWIDYNYDKILDTEERFNAYISSVLKLRNLDLSKFVQFHINDRETILEYNRNLFFTKPYDSLYEKIKNKISQR